MYDFEKMSIPELEKKLAEFKDSLEDIEEERSLVLGQRGIHLSSAAVGKYEAEIEQINKRINELEELLRKKRCD
ncbi:MULTISPECIES: hypothetical protein [Clostridium]|uniref:Uncharacterized protein n=1 Tax=Clostridium ragsdalei P11 TaxID=1353534 RepID=A0A1A6AJ84_9CLOT|nr:MULTISPECIES: hypothetical protein [Clostridium]OBR90114.1 hypothetical protein CLRAG_37210 [Clostridium ragsdalei P11]QXE18809.1 hypothetical protein B5S50_08180 [Clostridium sp. 001]